MEEIHQSGLTLLTAETQHLEHPQVLLKFNKMKDYRYNFSSIII